MKRALILTYYWPPAGGPGVQRWLKFTKYLGEFGWKARVVTVKDGTYSAIDNKLEEEVHEDISVSKTRSRDPFRFYNMLKGKKDGSVSVALININRKRSLIDRLAMYIRSNYFIPDGRKGWVPFAYREALKIIREESIDLVVTTGPPHSTHLAGLRLKQKTGVKWLADLRDPWTTVYYNDMLPRTSRTKRLDKNLEDEVLANADMVTVVSPGMQKEFSDRNPNVKVVMNGFDMKDMENVGIREDGKTRIPEFSLTYTGNFKPNQHIPEIWDGIIELINEDQDFSRQFKLRFVGNVDASVPEYFSSRGLKDNIELVDYVPHSEVTRIMKESTALLFVVPQSKNNKLIITGKLFEYLASGSPVLSVGPVDGDASGIISETGRSGMVDYTDRKKFRDQLMELFQIWKDGKGKIPELETGMLDRYSRRSSAELMAQYMKDVIS